jgi:hypothetical protein
MMNSAAFCGQKWQRTRKFAVKLARNTKTGIFNSATLFFSGDQVYEKFLVPFGTEYR